MNQCMVYSPDTDISLLLIFHYPSFPNALIFHTGKGLNLHNISIHSCYEALVFAMQMLCSAFIHSQVVNKLNILWENGKHSGGKTL